MSTRASTGARRAVVGLAAALACATGLPATAATPSDPTRCFGAASRDPAHPCTDPKLRLVVYPDPGEALRAPYAPCDALSLPDGLVPCRFGPEPLVAGPEAALVGDSHAGHWRAAVEPVMAARGWGATSLTKSGCPFTFARVARPAQSRKVCRPWSALLVAWLERHPRVHTVFVSGHTGTSVVPSGGRSAFATAVAGFEAAWRALPASVRTVVVLRDVPLRHVATQRCVERAIAARVPAGLRCAEARGAVLRPDPATAAARRPGGRAHVVDLTRFMCSTTRCFPVIGGALVNKDQSHLTTTFAASLAPYLQRRVDALVPRGG